MLSIQDASFAYSKRRVLHAVTMQVDQGRTCLLIGRNGSGKSSLLRLAAGLRAPTAGSVQWQGENISAIPPTRRARSVAWVSQRSMLAIDVTVRDVVEFGAVHGASSITAEALLHELALEPLAHRRFHELSGGEQQRCIVARALRQHADGGLLVLDEPLANLDPAESVRVIEALRQRCRRGAVVVAAMHDLSLVGQWADDVAVLDGGVLTAFGVAARVLQSSVLSSAFGCEFVGASGLFSVQLPPRQVVSLKAP